MPRPTRKKKPAPVPGPTVMVELTGAAHLHEFTSFWMKAVRGFDPRFDGGHSLRGPYLRIDGSRVPPMNTPIAYALPPKARALYIFGRSSHGAAHDVHLALAHEPGAQVVLPLTTATDAKRRDVARLASLLQHADFVVARTMPENPHCYTRRLTWAHDADFAFAVEGTRRYGYREKYVPPGAVRAAYSETVFASGEHFYWSGYLPIEATFWINRKPLASPATAGVVDQTLIVHDARLLEIPALPDGFAGLDTTITRCRHFQFGVATFGYERCSADLRPRLRKRT